jgi:hypothetical protein
MLAKQLIYFADAIAVGLVLARVFRSCWPAELIR